MTSAPTERTHGQWWNSTEPLVEVAIDQLAATGRAAYLAAGASADDAAFLVDTNLDKAIQGDHARGIGRLPGIVAAARAGDLDLAPTVEIVRQRGATAVVDGGPRAFGRLVCRRGMALAVELARSHGVGLVGARGSGELLTPFVRHAVDAGMIAMAMVQSVPTVAPLGGYRPLLGNGPLAFGIPAGERDPVIVDMSTTQSSASGVLLAAAQGEQIPPGLLLDAEGNPTTDAREFPDDEVIERLGGGIAVRGTLVPLGGSHKGYALVFVIGLLSMLLTDTDPPWELFYDLPERGRYGTVLLAADPGAFDPSGRAPSRVDDFVDTVTSAPRLAGVERILYPGQRSQELRRRRREAGVIAVPASHHRAMSELARELGLPELAAIAVHEPHHRRSRP